jgi:hypothetical protein
MYTLSKFQGLISIAFVALISWMAYVPLKTPTPKTANEAPTSFSAHRALEQLKVIAAEPHSSGTPAHKKVRNYIFDYCKKQGLDTRVINQTGLRQFRATAIAGNTLNIIATLKGSNSSKAVLVMSHYDSQPNSPGAADDGSGVAAMLETISLLTKGPKLKNDIIFLFTDLEEVGLLGAEAFANSYEELTNVGMILNYEARGNSGASFTFETSTENGFIVRTFSAAAEKPLANSLAYEIYKLMPNDTDFTMFKNTGISGLNSGFIDGFSYYHSMADTPENINLGSLQHQGDLMLSMTKYFGNLDLTETKSEDVIFFSLFNGNMIIYPLSWDIPLIVLTILLFIMVVVIGLKKEQLKLIHLLAGFGLFIASIAVSIGLIWVIQQLILMLNPHYTNFYSNNFYNAGYYLWSVIGLSLFSFVIIFQPFVKKISVLSMSLGSMALLIVLVVVLKYFIHSGTFILYVPLLPAILIMLVLITKTQLPQRYHQLGNLLLLIVPLILWVPFVYFLFVVFSLSLPYASAIFICFLFPFLLPSLPAVTQLHRYLPVSIAGLMVIVSLIVGQSSSSYTKAEPLQSQLCYGLNLDTNEAMWISPQEHQDEWTKQYIKTSTTAKIDDFYPNSTHQYWRDKAPLTNVATTRIEMKQDTVINNVRRMTIKLIPGAGTTVLNLWLSEGAYFKQIDKRKIEGDSQISVLRYYAPESSGVELTIITDLEAIPTLELIESKWGINEKLLTSPLPDNIVFGTGGFSNSMLIKRTFVLSY